MHTYNITKLLLKKIGINLMINFRPYFEKILNIWSKNRLLKTLLKDVQTLT